MSDVETLGRGNIGITVAQTLQGYVKADESPGTEPIEPPPTPAEEVPEHDQVRSLWARALAGTRRFSLRSVAVSEWVPRIPGLYHQPQARHLRMQGAWKPSDDGSFRVFRPNSKSSHVMGGIGTLRLGTDPDGFCRACVAPIDDVTLGAAAWASRRANASAGIPLRISEDLWGTLGLTEGSVVDLVDVAWRALPTGWSEFFPSIKGIPRGCLVVERPEQIVVNGGVAKVAVHPYSVMEYDSAAGQRLDFVYCEGSEDGWRGTIEKFFEWYRTVEDRHGRLLLGADLVEPLWDARYENPARLREANEADVALLEARAIDPELAGKTIDLLQRALVKADNPDLPRMLGQDVGLGAGWEVAGSMNEIVTALLAEAQRTDRLLPLLDAVQKEGIEIVPWEELFPRDPEATFGPTTASLTMRPPPLAE